ncbi:hypothetical protein [Cupriavidus metallidurans]|uniref:hypothetical protein n=1 Tax=Cupriavidus metallidurans TaxID=119219 RepID=UPI001CCEEFA9|nr:hypothetical protein [Cupriavidus metallidurans]UBM12714.1 hypothetical protein LAI70_28285 [Cupriavidus metallidurans]
MFQLEKIVKKKRRNYGAIYTRESDGERIYLAWRKHNEIYRCGHDSISDAMRAGKAGWAIDDETLLNLRATGIRFMGVLMRESQEAWITRLETFMLRGPGRLWYFHDHTARGGTPQRVLPLQHFLYVPRVRL